MPWLKVDDGEWCEPWVMIVGNAAYGLYVRLEGYAAQALTDGLVPAPVVAMILAGLPDDDPLQKLVDVGRVETRDTGSVVLPFFLDTNPCAAQVEADREKRREAGRKGGLKSRRT